MILLFITIACVQIISLNDEPIKVFQLSTEKPSGFNIIDPLPNAFSPVTSYKLEIPEDAFIIVDIYLNNENIIHFQKHVPIGIHNVHWNLNDNNGERVASGAYEVKIQIMSQVREIQIMHSHTLVLVI